ncbi:MAG: hypothetical protein AAGU75_17595 [Bacillota bacterium]
MTDTGLKNFLGYLLRNKNTVVSLLDHFKPDDMERGILAIPENIVNRDIKMLLMDRMSPYLNDYRFMFHQGCIFLDLDLNGKQLGRLKAKYMLTITQFDFHQEGHQIRFTYQEDVRSEGNFMQNMAVKAAGLKGSYLQTAAEMARLDFIDVDKDSFVVNIDRLKAAKKIPSSLSINYISSEDGILKLKFHI